MTAVFTDFYRTQLFNSLDTVVPIDPNTNLMQTGKSVHWTFFRYHATFTGPNDSRYTGIRTVSDLLGLKGWSPPLTPNSSTQAVGATTPATTSYCLANAAFTMGGGWTASTVTAAALVLEGSYGGVTDPIIYITDTPFAEGTVLAPGDTLLGRPVTALGPTNRPIFSWPMYTAPAAGQPAPTTVVLTEGSIAVAKAAPPYEISYMQHCWLYPQRVNMIANPSFEAVPGTNHWRTNGTLTRVLGTPTVPVSPGGGAAYGHFVGTNPVIAESNSFPTHIYSEVNDQWTIQAMIRGSGRVRVGLLGWENNFLTTQSDWGDDGKGGPQTWTIPATGFLHIYARRRSFENTSAMVRFECEGNFDLDNVLCEPDWLTDWPYFDGDSTYGARGDFSWYGGTNRKGQTYSLWYNHRRAVTGRLFAYDIDDADFTITDEEVEAQGFVYKWVPAGVRVTPHLDVLWPNDIQEPVPDNAGTAITPYDSGSNGGVTNPWV